VRRSPGLERAYHVVLQTLGRLEADEVFVHRPARILAGGTLEVPAIRSKKRAGFLGKLGMRGLRRKKSIWSKEYT
jgi:hypothetical protein